MQALSQRCLRRASWPRLKFAAGHAAVALALAAAPAAAAEPLPPIEPLLRTVDLNVGESATVTLCDGSTATAKLLDLRETRDSLRDAVRRAEVTVEVNGQRATLVSANYRLPVTLGKAQIDCAVTKGCVQKDKNPWALDKDARFRLWPAGSPWIQPATFVYPLRQRWFATDTQIANEPVFVDGGERPAAKAIYYHWGLDQGGAEGLTEVVAATEAVVVTAGKETIQPPDFPKPVEPRYDVVYLRDGRSWHYRYSHLHTIDPAVRPGARIKIGQRIGLLGKEGGSGGWAHLHFDIVAPQPSGRWGIVEAYAFYWQAYLAEHRPKLLAVARPHHLAAVGQTVQLDATRSWSAAGPQHIRSFRWTFCDGTTADGATPTRQYARPGTYSETLKVTDADGLADYDFAVVQVCDPAQPDRYPPSIHAVYWPTFGLKAGDEVTFLVRSFRVRPDEGCERWDFGDGSPAVEVRSDGNAKQLAKDGYAATRHRYRQSGHYLASVERTNDRGEKAIGRLHVRIEPR